MHSDHMSLDQMALFNCGSHNLSFNLTYGDNIFTQIIILKNLNKMYSTSNIPRELEKIFSKVHVKHDVNPSISSETHLRSLRETFGFESLFTSLHNCCHLHCET